jgi:bacteriorhodopsin
MLARLPFLFLEFPLFGGSIIITLFIIAVIFAIIYWIIRVTPMGPIEPFKWVLYCILGLAAIIVLLGLIGVKLP